MSKSTPNARSASGSSPPLPDYLLRRGVNKGLVTAALNAHAAAHQRHQHMRAEGNPETYKAYSDVVAAYGRLASLTDNSYAKAVARYHEAQAKSRPAGHTIPKYDPALTKAERQTERLRLLPIIQQAIEDAYRQCPVRHVRELDAIAREAVEDATGDLIDEGDRIGSGRHRLDNLADWVKAHHTQRGLTIETTIGDVSGYRIWIGAVGQIDGRLMVPAIHQSAIIMAMQTVFAAQQKGVK